MFEEVILDQKPINPIKVITIEIILLAITILLYLFKIWDIIGLAVGIITSILTGVWYLYKFQKDKALKALGEGTPWQIEKYLR